MGDNNKWQRQTARERKMQKKVKYIAMSKIVNVQGISYKGMTYDVGRNKSKRADRGADIKKRVAERSERELTN